jgi:NAD(P)H-dependent FMN reductase
MIVPEWNGSFPYSFKKLIDDSGYPSWLKDKSILLIGTSNTTFGNVMGTSHLKYILEHIGANVYRKIISIPHINDKFVNDDIIIDERLANTVKDFCR